MKVSFPVKAIAGFSRASFRALVIGIALGMALPMHAAAESHMPEAQADLTSLSLEELLAVEVYSASKFTQKTAEAPAAVTVVTATDIRNHGYRTLADILASARGLFVTYDRNYQYVGVRGFNRPGDYNSRILLLVDGYRVNDAVYDTASIGQEFFLDVDLIERVEIVRGPGSSIYGSNAFFGVVNVFTKRGRDFDGAEISAEAANYDSGKGRLTYGRQLENGAELLLSATGADSNGQDLYFPEYDAPATNNGLATGLDRDNAKRLYGKLAYNDFTLTGAWSERVKSIPTAPYGSVFNAQGTESADTQTVLDLAYYGRLNERQSLSARVYYGNYFYTGLYPWNQPPVTVNKDQSWAEWWGAETQLHGDHGNHKLVLGAEYQDNFRQDQVNQDVAPYTLYMDDRRSSKRTALYVQDEVALSKKLLLNAGVRYDHYSTVGGTANPRLALIYNPQQTTALKVLYGTAFRAPNAYELYYIATGSKASLNLKPEEITSYEFVAEHELQPNFRLAASIYQNEISNLINQVANPADGLLVFQNIGQVKARGAEFEAERAWSDDMRLRASHAWQITRDQTTGAELENSPRQLAKLNYSQRLRDDALHAGVELQYTGPRKTLAGATTGGHTVANLTLLSGKLARGLEFSASIYNLFDKRYADPARPEHVPIDAIAQNGRNYRLKLDYGF